MMTQGNEEYRSKVILASSNNATNIYFFGTMAEVEFHGSTFFSHRKHFQDLFFQFSEAWRLSLLSYAMTHAFGSRQREDRRD
jgi:hypothetical protein